MITDSNLARLYPQVLQAFDLTVVVPAGEPSKSLACYAEVSAALATGGLKRQGTIYAFGGGVVGDLAGFVAATYMRGVSFVQWPTSLLAMVDSSVGAKVGIDLPEGKNLLGSFWAPTSVALLTETLSTLPAKQFANGMAEVIKYGAILGEPLFKELEGRPLTETDDRLQTVVLECIRMKKEVVEQDEFELTGLRAVLNFGHTVGHALEKVTGYARYDHGEAVAIGMVAEARLASLLGVGEPEIVARIESVLRSHNLPTDLPTDIGLDEMIDAMKGDKKSDGQGLAFALVPQIGRCTLHTGISNDAVREALT